MAYPLFSKLLIVLISLFVYKVLALNVEVIELLPDEETEAPTNSSGEGEAEDTDGRQLTLLIIEPSAENGASERLKLQDTKDKGEEQQICFSFQLIL